MTQVVAAEVVAGEATVDLWANAVTRWFGSRFTQLHPLLQDLHRRGGRLSGRVQITFGRGPAKWIGQRLARRLGVPTGGGERGFEVEIAHTDAALLWTRRFDDGTVMRSVFEPVGTWPDGHWIERTGPLQMRLTVDIVEGGWQWRPLGMRFADVPLPLWLFPKSRAGKRIVDGRYVFSVAFALPVLGTLLCYEGALDAQSM